MERLKEKSKKTVYKDALVCINGNFTPPEEAMVSIFDRGFLYGDSVYEVTLTYEQTPFLWREHLERLKNSASGIGMELSWSDEELTKLVYEGIKRIDCKRQYIRLIVTRGGGEIGLDPNLSDGQNLFIIFRELPEHPKDYYEKGVSLITAEIMRNPKRAVDPNVKSGNYLNNVLAISQAKEKGAYDAIMLNSKGFVTESTSSNIWIVEGDRFLTPPIEAGLLGGITRASVIEIGSKHGLNVYEEQLSPERVRDAQEVFITSSTREIMPVTKVDGQVIGNGSPGPQTKKLHQLYKDFVAERIAEEKKKASSFLN